VKKIAMTHIESQVNGGTRLTIDIGGAVRSGVHRCLHDQLAILAGEKLETPTVVASTSPIRHHVQPPPS
jgi:hypothetical protein